MFPLLAFGLILFGCASIPAPPQTWRYSGHALVEQKCGGCHAVDIEDYSPNHAAPPFRDLHARYPADTLEKAFASDIFHAGRDEMPRFLLSSRQRAAILAYLVSLDPCTNPSPYDLATRRCPAPSAAKP